MYTPLDANLKQHSLKYMKKDYLPLIYYRLTKQCIIEEYIEVVNPYKNLLYYTSFLNKA